MCGIAGHVARDAGAPVPAATVARMLRALVARGPDGEGVHAADGVGLGVRRLAIVDPEHGDQPLGNEDGNVVVVCNGEIYDAPETRDDLVRRGHVLRTRSDVEVIAHLYEEHGLGFVEHLRGMFALALWDARRRRLVLARDRFGMKPLCWHESRDGLWFASEAKAILAAGALDARLDARALRDVLTFGFVRTPRTMLDGIASLPPAHLLVHEDGRTRIERYWDVDFGRATPRRSDAAWLEALRATLTESVRLHLRSDVPVGVLLSGGLDSSVIASLMARITGKSVRSFSLGFDRPEADELRRGMLFAFPGAALEPRTTVATAYDLSLLPLAVWCAEDASVAVTTAFWRLRLAALAAREVKVVLTGEGSDEALGGYPWYRGEKLFRALALLPRALRSGPLASALDGVRPGFARLLRAPDEMGPARFLALMTARTWERASRLLAPDLVAGLARDGDDADADELDALELPAAFASWHPFDRLQYLDQNLRLVDFVNHGLDRASMAYSLEARLPFLDHRFVELCAALPRRLRMRGLTEKYALRRAMRGLVPDEILARAKRGTRSPTAGWLAEGPLPSVLDDALSSASIAAVGVLRPAAVAALRARQRAGDASATHDLLTAVAVQLWHEQFVAGRGAPPRPTLEDLDHGSTSAASSPRVAAAVPSA